MSPRSSEKKSNLADGPNVYLGLLFVSVAALVAGIGFLASVLGEYGWEVAK